MIPLIQNEITTRGWLSLKEFADIVAISQMTPGPLAVNAATYVGYLTAGFFGSFFATLGVSLPSFILTLLVARFIEKFKKNPVYEYVLKGIRPVTIGLLASATIFFAEMSVFTGKLPLTYFKDLLTNSLKDSYSVGINFGGLAIFLIIIFLSRRFKLNPIYAVIISAILGILLM